jgi:hypothetical protein
LDPMAQKGSVAEELNLSVYALIFSAKYLINLNKGKNIRRLA